MNRMCFKVPSGMSYISASWPSSIGFITFIDPWRRYSASHTLPGNLCQLQDSPAAQSQTFLLWFPHLHAQFHPSWGFPAIFILGLPGPLCLTQFLCAYSLETVSFTFASVSTSLVLFLMSAVLLINCNCTLPV